MNCPEFTRWLDAGRPARREHEAREHAASCVRCADLLRAEREIEALLARPAVQLPDRARFVDRVMAEVVSADPKTRSDLLPAPPPLPWWVEAAADPAAVLACALTALLLWRPDALARLMRLVSDRWSAFAWPAVEQARSLLALDRPVVATGLGFLGLLLLGWICIHLYRWTERLARRSAGA